MTTRPRSYRTLGRKRGRRRRAVAVLAVLVGLVAMHHLAGALPGLRHSASATATVMASAQATPGDECDGPDGHCPTTPHSHPGSVCQPTPPTGHIGVAHPPVAVAPVPAPPARLAAGSPSHEAGNGSGCGPPSRSQLQVLRI